MTRKAATKDFFISYNKADRAWAEWIAWQLEEGGYTTVLQAWDFRPGSNFVLEMDEAVTAADSIIAILSPYYLQSRFTQLEWTSALAQDPTGEKGMLLPVRVRECELDGLLAQILYVDLVGLDEAKARDTLLDAVRRGRAKPELAPGFPGPAAERSVVQQPSFPGALPPVWNLPHLRNPNFTGRGELLQDLRDALDSGQHAALTQAITGLGGVGKTQLAVEYAYRHAGDYGMVWWIRAEEETTLAGDYAELARPLELDLPQDASLDDARQAVRRWLDGNGGWLMVFDNARERNDVLNYLPQGPTGHVIITSRNPDWDAVARPLLVRVLERPQSVEFLLNRTGQDDSDDADKLADALGDLPLALDQAAGYIQAAGKSLADYLSLFRTRERELLKRGKVSTGYEHTVASTWDISLRELRKLSPAAVGLLNLCAFLAPDDIPLDVIRGSAEHLPKPLAAAARDAIAFDEAAAALRRYSLAEVTGNLLTVHRLVQAVTRDRLSEEQTKKWAEAAARAVNEHFPFDSDDVRTWPDCARLLPHALAASRHPEGLQVAMEPTGRLLNHVGGYLWGRAEFPRAKEVYERAVEIEQAAFGPGRPEVASVVNNLGSVLQALGDLQGARDHFQRALSIDEAALGPDHPSVARDVNNLGLVLQDLGDLEGARDHIQRALSIDEAAFGPDHPEVASVVNNLGLVLKDLGDLEGARDHFQRALSIDEAAFGKNHPSVATDVNNLGLVLRDLGDLEGARHHFQRALGIFRKSLGDEHPSTVTVRWNLESLAREMGDKNAG